MQLFITIFHVVLCLALIAIILLQPGKDQGSVFGGGAGGNKMYGPRGQGNFLGRATTLVAVMFMVTSITLAWFSTERVREGSNIEDALKEAQEEEDAAVPAEPPGGTLTLPPPTDLAPAEPAGLVPAPAEGAPPAPADGAVAPAPAGDEPPATDPVTQPPASAPAPPPPAPGSP